MCFALGGDITGRRLPKLFVVGAITDYRCETAGYDVGNIGWSYLRGNSTSLAESVCGHSVSPNAAGPDLARI